MAHVTRWPASDWNWDQALSCAPLSRLDELCVWLLHAQLTRLQNRLRSKIMASISYLRSTKDRMLLLEQLDVSIGSAIVKCAVIPTTFFQNHFTNDA
jgi:hypothetical protein